MKTTRRKGYNMSTVCELGLMSEVEYAKFKVEYNKEVKVLTKGLPRKTGVSLRDYAKEILQEAEYSGTLFNVLNRFKVGRTLALMFKQ